MVGTGILQNSMKSPLSWMLHDILDHDHIQWHPQLIGHYTNFWPLLIWTLLPNLTFYLIVQGFHRTYATDAACQQRTLTPPDTWSCPTLGLACVSNVETNLSWTCLVSGLLSFEHPSVLLFCCRIGVYAIRLRTVSSPLSLNKVGSTNFFHEKWKAKNKNGSQRRKSAR